MERVKWCVLQSFVVYLCAMFVIRMNLTMLVKQTM